MNLDKIDKGNYFNIVETNQRHMSMSEALIL